MIPKDSNNNALSRRKLLQAGGVGLAASALAPHAAAQGVPAERVPWQLETDVVVCGSGAAGATAALFACKAGAAVTVLEKGSAWGGTTAKSGCHIWIPNNFELRARDIRDPKRECLQYMAQYSWPALFNPDDLRLGLPDNTYELLAAFYDNAAPMVEQMMRWGAFSFRAARAGPDRVYTPDYFDHSVWNRVPRGRGLEPYEEGVNYAGGRNVVDSMRRTLAACGADIRLRHRAQRLLLDEQRNVMGLVVINDAGEELNIRARRGVVFATGCYSHNKDLLQQYQMHPLFGGCGVPTNTGDFIRIAGEIGAQLGNMSGAWRAQVVLDETLAYSSVPAAVYWPPGESMLLVNKYGKRCVNEKRSYNDRSRQLYNWDATAVEYPNLLQFMVYDQRTADLSAGMYPIPPLPTGADYVIRGNTLEQLSANIGARLQQLRRHTGGVALDSAFSTALSASIARFNDMARRGVDEDFGRGAQAEDRDWHALFPQRQGTRWEPSASSDHTMYPLQQKGPYYAIILCPGALGTNGGPLVNARTEVLDYNNKAIGGLYAAGNCMAHPAGNAYWAAGATIGSAMTYGKIAGEQVAAR